MILILTDFEDFPKIHDMIWMRKERKKKKNGTKTHSFIHVVTIIIISVMVYPFSADDLNQPLRRNVKKTVAKDTLS